MKELGTYLKEVRTKNGVQLDEVSEDLKIDINAIENIEEGNIRAFKDMYSLKELVKDYAKYLGLDANYVVEEFNDFLFCHTSKISLEDIKKEQLKEKIEEKKVYSPYTKLPKPKKDLKKLYITLGAIALSSLLLFIVFKIMTHKDNISSELKGSEIYEFTYKNYSI